MKKLFSTRYSDVAFNVAMLLLRAGWGVMMLPHGYKKLVNYETMAQKFADPFHLGTGLSLVLTIFAEFFCSILLIMGLFTRLAVLPLIVAMLVALFYAHKGLIFSEGEMAGLYLTGFVVIFLLGPGKISLDKVIGK